FEPNNSKISVKEIIMKSWTYPVVFVLNPETNFYNAFVPDLAICSEGETKELALQEMQNYVKRYFELATKYNTEVPEASTLEQITKKWEGYQVMLLTSVVGDADK
ncbi:MAG: hypothetical protein FWD32_01720, partial [Firmicutes bacterium]|nr:hypothetical protein [Bacillota bacterium]